MNKNNVTVITPSNNPSFSSFISKEIIDRICVDSNKQYFIFPGFCDVHVHFREPGFSYKETILTGSKAAAHGGYTTVCAMPNLNPVIDTKEHLQQELEVIQRDAVIDVRPYAAITIGQMGKQLADLSSMSEDVIAFSDDGHGVQSDDMMRQAMIQSKNLGKIITAHCEVNDLLKGGYIHDGIYAQQHGHKGICSESEWRQIERDIQLSKETGCPYHVCHISTKESVELIRQAKKDGVDITCETGPHYLLLDENDLQEDGRFKMNPPLRSKEDRLALLEGIQDGTIDCIATDHAPHSAEEKSKGLAKSAMGIVGIETAFPLLYTYLVEKGTITLDRLMELLVINPRKRFSLPLGHDYSIWVKESDTIDPNQFLSKGRATPFAGWNVDMVCLATIYNDKIVYEKGTV